MNSNILIILSFILPLFGIFIASFWHTNKLFINNLKIFQVIISAISILQIIIFLPIYNGIKSDGIIILNQIDGISIDYVSYCLILLFLVIIFLVNIYSFTYIEENRQGLFFTFIFSIELGIILCLSASHLFLFFIFWELMVLSGYILVIFEKTDESIEAGFKYLIISSFGSIEILMGIALIASRTNDLQFSALLANSLLLNDLLVRLGQGFIIAGFGITAGFIFFNQWLPDAHPAAPAPVSAILSGIVVKIGVYAIFRISTDLSSISSSKLIIIIAILTMTEGNIMVFAQFLRKDSRDLKRILAYSSTVHLGYLLLIVSLNSKSAIIALILHIANHAIAKSLLFLIAGLLYKNYHTRELSLLRGAIKSHGIQTISFILSLFSLGGIPGTGGFFSKFLVISTFYSESPYAITNINLNQILTLLVLINTILALIGYLWLIKILGFDNSDEPREKLEIKLIHKFVFLILCILILYLGIFPNQLISAINSLI